MAKSKSVRQIDKRVEDLDDWLDGCKGKYVSGWSVFVDGKGGYYVDTHGEFDLRQLRTVVLDAAFDLTEMVVEQNVEAYEPE